MRYLLSLISLLLFAGSVNAQDISINATAEVQVPADNISFQINLNAEADTPLQAYETHKKREDVLVKLLKKHNISEKKINFEPISISKVYRTERSGERIRKVQTRQTVMLNLEDFSKYEDIQITLIDNGFDDFSGRFISSKSKEAEDEALKKVLKLARRKADIIANQTDVSIDSIKAVNYSYNSNQPQPMREMSFSKASDSGLMQFKQTVSITAHVSVTYSFKPNG